MIQPRVITTSANGVSKVTIRSKGSNCGTVFDINDQHNDIDLHYSGQIKYAILLPSYFNIDVEYFKSINEAKVAFDNNLDLSYPPSTIIDFEGSIVDSSGKVIERIDEQRTLADLNMGIMTQVISSQSNKKGSYHYFFNEKAEKNMAILKNIVKEILTALEKAPIARNIVIENIVQKSSYAKYFIEMAIYYGILNKKLHYNQMSRALEIV